MLFHFWRLYQFELYPLAFSFLMYVIHFWNLQIYLVLFLVLNILLMLYLLLHLGKFWTLSWIFLYLWSLFFRMMDMVFCCHLWSLLILYLTFHLLSYLFRVHVPILLLICLLCVLFYILYSQLMGLRNLQHALMLPMFLGSLILQHLILLCLVVLGWIFFSMQILRYFLIRFLKVHNPKYLLVLHIFLILGK